MDIHERLHRVRMSESERQVAASALRTADRLCALAAWIARSAVALTAALAGVVLRRSARRRLASWSAPE